MQNASFLEVQNALRSHGQRRLAGLVESMAQRIELLDEDNRQLSAAVTIYREVIRRIDVHAGSIGESSVGGHHENRVKSSHDLSY